MVDIGGARVSPEHYVIPDLGDENIVQVQRHPSPKAPLDLESLIMHLLSADDLGSIMVAQAAVQELQVGIQAAVFGVALAGLCVDGSLLIDTQSPAFVAVDACHTLDQILFLKRE